MFSLASDSSNSQYILISVCTGLVIAFTIIIFPILNYIIKDKSYVIAIFSDMDIDEVKKVIEDTRKLNLVNLNYKKKWIKKSNGQQDYFWRKLINDPVRDRTPQPDISPDPSKKKKVEEEEIKAEENKEEQEQDQDKEKAENDEEKNKEIKPEEMQSAIMETEKKLKRKAALTAIE